MNETFRDTCALFAASTSVALLASATLTAAPQRGGERWVEAGTKVGEKLPALHVLNLDGTRRPLAETWATQPVVFVTASLTCPVARGTCTKLSDARRVLGDSAAIVILYTTEAHPNDVPSPYRPESPPWITKDNEKDGILRAQPKSNDERLALAREFRILTELDLPIVVDAIDDAAWTALGAGPNMAVLVDRDGVIRLKQGWLDPASIAGAVMKDPSMKDSTTSTPATRTGSGDASTPSANRRYSASGHDITPLPKERVAELAKKLSPEAREVTQNHGTEAAGSCGVFLDNKKDGTYTCVVCGLPLFSSSGKFHSGTGWPSFFEPVDPKHVRETRDGSHGMERVEITCARCNAHLGHVFDDGPRDKTGLRYCLNGVALDFKGKDEAMPKESQPALRTAYFAGGCFWGVEHVFQQCPGVIDAESGYMNGHTANPTYHDVCGKKTGHAEAVKVVFDPTRVTYRQLLEGFFELHDPTQLNRQGPDTGDQYRSAVFTVDEAQLAEAKAYVAELTKKGRFPKPIVTVIEPAKPFYKAEADHQDYVAVTGNACHVSNPWPKIFGAAAR